MKILPVEAELFHAARVDKCRDMMKEGVVFRNLVNAPPKFHFLPSQCMFAVYVDPKIIRGWKVYAVTHNNVI